MCAEGCRMCRWCEPVRTNLALLDGSTRSAVRMLTGYTDAEIDNLGGFDEADDQ